MTDMDEDDAFDAALRAALDEEPVETAELSRAVLTRIAAPPKGPIARGAEVLALPGPAVGAFGGLMLLTTGLGYMLLPAMGGESWAALGLFGDLIGLGGGF